MKNSADFVSKLSGLIANTTTTMLSYDVCSLFTMVPVQEACDMAVDLIRNDSKPRFDLSPEIWVQMFKFSTRFCNFQFLDKNYDMVDGLAMGNPLAAPLANLFMIHIEQHAIELALSSNPPVNEVSWYRYVDDCFCRILDCSSAIADNFLDILNSVNPAIQFTSELEVNSNLNFLDVGCTVDPLRGAYTTSVYRKPTHTNLYILWSSAHPPSQLIGIFRTLLFRARTVCNNALDFAKEKKFLTEVFLDNKYPPKVLAKALQKFDDTPKGETSVNPPISSNGGKPISLVLPYIPKISESLARRWKHHATNFNLGVDTRVVFKPIKKLRSFFPLCPPNPDGRCVYRATCPSCNKAYVGETGLDLSTRISTHKKSSASALSDHCASHGHSFDRLEWQNLCNEGDNNRRKIAEGILIRDSEPILNNTRGTMPYVFV